MRKADVIIIDEIHQLPLENQLLLYVVVHDLMPRNQLHSMPEPVASQKMNEFYERRFLLMSATLDVWEMKVYLKKQVLHTMSAERERESIVYYRRRID